MNWFKNIFLKEKTIIIEAKTVQDAIDIIPKYTKGKTNYSIHLKEDVGKARFVEPIKRGKRREVITIEW